MMTFWHVDMLTCWQADKNSGWHDFGLLSLKLWPSQRLTRVKSRDASASKNYSGDIETELKQQYFLLKSFVFLPVLLSQEICLWILFHCYATAVNTSASRFILKLLQFPSQNLFLFKFWNVLFNSLYLLSSVQYICNCCWYVQVSLVFSTNYFFHYEGALVENENWTFENVNC